MGTPIETPEASNDIAIVGMSCRVAGANSPSELWDLLASSRDVQRGITRFNTKGFYHPDGGLRKGMTNVKSAYLLEDDVIDRFDHAFFQTTPVEAIAMDPQQRMLLEIVYEAVENAGIPLDDFVGTDTAVFAGEGLFLGDVIPFWPMGDILMRLQNRNGRLRLQCYCSSGY